MFRAQYEISFDFWRLFYWNIFRVLKHIFLKFEDLQHTWLKNIIDALNLFVFWTILMDLDLTFGVLVDTCSTLFFDFLILWFIFLSYKAPQISSWFRIRILTLSFLLCLQLSLSCETIRFIPEKPTEQTGESPKRDSHSFQMKNKNTIH